ncbi:MAG: hypothetical protein GY719_21615 [bacterium]|nr:hypothetical protein [bacterium]
MAKEKAPTKPRPESLFDQFLKEKNDLAGLLSENLNQYFEQEKKPEIELVRIYLRSFTSSLQNAGTELKKQFVIADTETQALVESHVNNTNVIGLLSGTNGMLRERRGVLGFLEKILPILEIVKKIIIQLIELFPNFLEKILKKIILPILELVENLIKQILELFSPQPVTSYFRSAEMELLTTHPLWRRMLFDTVETSGAASP